MYHTLRLSHLPFRPALLALAVLGSSWAHAGLFGDDEARKAILELREEVRALQEGQNQMRQEQSASLLNLQSQIESLKQQNAQLTGRLEELESKPSSLTNASLGQDIESNNGQIALRLDGQDIQISAEEKLHYDSALQQFQAGDFRAAEQGFKSLLTQYPGSDYTPWVHYWVGNSQYALKRFQDAAASFRQVIASSHTNPKAPEAALSMANCQSELGQKAESLRTLENLSKVYPNSEAAQIAREKIARSKQSGGY